MDDIDARIVAFLVRDARASYALIGGEVGLSAPAVKRRVDRLRAAGAITGFSARVDPAAMGWTTEALRGAVLRRPHLARGDRHRRSGGTPRWWTRARSPGRPTR